MTIVTKFELGQRLYIKDADFLACRVASIRASGANLWYEVEYWVSGDLKVASLADWALSKTQPGSGKAGFEEHK